MEVDSAIFTNDSIPESNLDEAMGDFTRLVQKSYWTTTRNYQSFRQTNDNRYQEKVLDEKKKVIYEENANEIKLLTDKITRRDKIIKALRNRLLVDIVATKTGTSDESSLKEKAKNNENFWLAQAMDDNQLMTNRLIEAESVISRLRNKLSDQKNQISEKMLDYNRLDFELRDKIRSLEIDISRHLAGLQLKDYTIEKLNSDLTKSNTEVSSLKIDIQRTTLELKQVTDERDNLLRAGSDALSERDKALAQCEQLKTKNSGLLAQMSKLEGENSDFKKRYETLVIDLDKMVAQKFLNRPHATPSNNTSTTTTNNGNPQDHQGAKQSLEDGRGGVVVGGADLKLELKLMEATAELKVVETALQEEKQKITSLMQEKNILLRENFTLKKSLEGKLRESESQGQGQQKDETIVEERGKDSNHNDKSKDVDKDKATEKQREKEEKPKSGAKSKARGSILETKNSKQKSKTRQSMNITKDSPTFIGQEIPERDDQDREDSAEDVASITSQNSDSNVQGGGAGGSQKSSSTSYINNLSREQTSNSNDNNNSNSNNDKQIDSSSSLVGLGVSDGEVSDGESGIKTFGLTEAKVNTSLDPQNNDMREESDVDDSLFGSLADDSRSSKVNKSKSKHEGKDPIHKIVKQTLAASLKPKNTVRVEIPDVQTTSNNGDVNSSAATAKTPPLSQQQPQQQQLQQLQLQQTDKDFRAVSTQCDFIGQGVELNTESGDMEGIEAPTEKYLLEIFKSIQNTTKSHSKDARMTLSVTTANNISGAVRAKYLTGKMRTLSNPAYAVNRLKHAHGFLLSIVRERDMFVRDVSKKPLWEALNCRMFVRCLDLLLQAFDKSLNPEEEEKIVINVNDSAASASITPPPTSTSTPSTSSSSSTERTNPENLRGDGLNNQPKLTLKDAVRSAIIGGSAPSSSQVADSALTSQTGRAKTSDSSNPHSHFSNVMDKLTKSRTKMLSNSKKQQQKSLEDFPDEELFPSHPPNPNPNPNSNILPLPSDKFAQDLLNVKNNQNNSEFNGSSDSMVSNSSDYPPLPLPDLAPAVPNYMLLEQNNNNNNNNYNLNNNNNNNNEMMNEMMMNEMMGMPVSGIDVSTQTEGVGVVGGLSSKLSSDGKQQQQHLQKVIRKWKGNMKGKGRYYHSDDRISGGDLSSSDDEDINSLMISIGVNSGQNATKKKSELVPSHSSLEQNILDLKKKQQFMVLELETLEKDFKIKEEELLKINQLLNPSSSSSSSSSSSESNPQGAAQAPRPPDVVPPSSQSSSPRTRQHTRHSSRSGTASTSGSPLHSVPSTPGTHHGFSYKSTGNHYFTGYNSPISDEEHEDHGEGEEALHNRPSQTFHPPPLYHPHAWKGRDNTRHGGYGSGGEEDKDIAVEYFCKYYLSDEEDKDLGIEHPRIKKIFDSLQHVHDGGSRKLATQLTGLLSDSHPKHQTAPISEINLFLSVPPPSKSPKNPQIRKEKSKEKGKDVDHKDPSLYLSKKINYPPHPHRGSPAAILRHGHGVDTNTHQLAAQDQQDRIMNRESSQSPRSISKTIHASLRDSYSAGHSSEGGGGGSKVDRHGPGARGATQPQPQPSGLHNKRNKYPLDALSTSTPHSLVSNPINIEEDDGGGEFPMSLSIASSDQLSSLNFSLPFLKHTQPSPPPVGVSRGGGMGLYSADGAPLPSDPHQLSVLGNTARQSKYRQRVTNTTQFEIEIN